MAHILHVVISGEMAGGQKVCLDLILDRLAMGDRVSVTSPSLGSFTDRCPEEVPISILPFRTLWDLGRIPKLVQYLRRIKPDLVHSHTMVSGNILWRLACKIVGVPIINHIHTDNYFGGTNLKAMCVRLVDTLTSYIPLHYVAVSEQTAHSIKNQGYPKERISVIHNGVSWFDPGDIHSSNSSNIPSHSIIGCVGRLCESKGQADLLKVFPRILDVVPDATLWFIGKDQETGGKYEHMLKQLAKSLQVEERVVFFGHRDDVRELMQQMKLLILPSYYEGFPIVLLEAMALGVPAVATRIAGVPEIINDGEMGYLITPGDLDSLATRIIELLSDSQLRLLFGHRGKQQVIEQFTKEKMLNKIRSIYTSILT